MKKLIREIPLANGLTVRFFDATRRYFGDYHQVRISICCEVPLNADLFEDAAAHHDAAKLLGGSVSYSKDIEHQGVATDDIPGTVEKVIQHFVDHSLSYLSGSEFPRKLVQSELKRILGKRKAFVVGGYRG
ncbi:hypothetical protein Gbem_2057 [Citrifermentans bemidjiense Bem]|uniref:Uncharacterized protein n=1 Tax=Citrifermentans bemidjiense (strain ATCC BAA-1014 / DSM 16622 / JCM 12645 / Bem) TaxID=404380 RepID=B5ECN5_CITBB|nr:hypothetical protein [Citrifermentans bemidjiense]ACH39070.1 hypothetical protein Gbem_2057 [Citrifermentans bemidjiense Bem]